MPDTDFSLEQATLAFERGHFAEAARIARQLVADAPNNSSALMLLGESLVEDGDVHGGISYLERALTTDPADMDVRYALGDACFEAGNTARATEVYQSIVELDQGQVDALVSLGLVNFNMDCLDRAEHYYRLALELEPESLFALQSLGDACFSAGRYDEAGACFLKALELDPEDPQNHYHLAVLFHEQNELTKAADHCRKAVGLDPDFAFAYLTFGNICLDQDLVQEAVQCFRSFLKLEKSPSFYEIRDEVGALLKDLEQEL